MSDALILGIIALIVSAVSGVNSIVTARRNRPALEAKAKADVAQINAETVSLQNHTISDQNLTISGFIKQLSDQGSMIFSLQATIHSQSIEITNLKATGVIRDQEIDRLKKEIERKDKTADAAAILRQTEALTRQDVAHESLLKAVTVADEAAKEIAVEPIESVGGLA